MSLRILAVPGGRGIFSEAIEMPAFRTAVKKGVVQQTPPQADFPPSVSAFEPLTVRSVANSPRVCERYLWQFLVTSMKTSLSPEAIS